MRKLILDLCGGTGAWSKPYAEDDSYEVKIVTLPDDVRLFQPRRYAHGILAAPPCRVFASSGARWPRTEGEILEGLSVVDACMRIILSLKPKWWALENPTGRLSKFLGPPEYYFDPCDYGDPYVKRTLLWGSFSMPEPSRVEPVDGSKICQLSTEERSITPAGFAKAFKEANP